MTQIHNSRAAVLFILLSFLIFGWGCNTEKDDPHAGHDHGSETSHAADGSDSNDHLENDSDHEDHDGHDRNEEGQGEHGEDGSNRLELTDDQRSRINLELATAGPGSIATEATFPGEIVLDPDRVVHVAQRVSGFVRESRKTLGDRVAKGEVLAVLESRELAEAKAAFLASASRQALAEVNFAREEKLYKEMKISAEQEFLVARQTLEEAQIETRTARQRLYALGFARKYVDQLPEAGDTSLTRYELTSPVDGVVVAKHATVGELLGVETSAFTVADLDSVWVVFNVYQKDLALVKAGQKVSIEIRPGSYREGMVSYVSPLIDEQTRTVQARVVSKNSDGAMQPGLFVTVRVAASINDASIVVPSSAIQTLEEKEVIFIEDGDGFEAVPVVLGKENGELAIVVSGLRTGQRYVVRGAFELKSQIVASGMGAHAGHGH